MPRSEAFSEILCTSEDVEIALAELEDSHGNRTFVQV